MKKPDLAGLHTASVLSLLGIIEKACVPVSVYCRPTCTSLHYSASREGFIAGTMGAK